jgi:hypothetical protein
MMTFLSPYEVLCSFYSRYRARAKAVSSVIFVTILLGDTTQAQEQPSALEDERKVEIRARGVSGQERIRLIVDEQIIATWNLTTSIQSYYETTYLKGPIKVDFFNDSKGRDVRVDSIKINGVVHQAEDQRINTGAFQNGQCGGGKGRTEWIRCNGYIEFSL